MISEIFLQNINNAKTTKKSIKIFLIILLKKQNDNNFLRLIAINKKQLLNKIIFLLKEKQFKSDLINYLAFNIIMIFSASSNEICKVRHFITT